jgi:hypothetical protein
MRQKHIVHELANELEVRRDLREMIAAADRSIELAKQLNESYRTR